MPDPTQPQTNKKNRVVITRANSLSPDPRVMKIGRALREGGYTVTLVGWNMSGDQPNFEHLDGFPCYRLALPAKFGRGLVNMFHQLRWQIALSAWLSRHRHEYDLIHACDFDTVLAALYCKYLYRKIVIYDIFDFYADMLRATPSLVKRIIRFVDLQAIQRADALILADKSRYQQVRGSHPKRSEVIYNVLDDLPQVSTRPAQPQSTQPGLRLAYFGNLQVERGLLELLDVLQTHPQWDLDLGGFGGDKELIRERAAQLPNVHWHGQIPYDRVIELSGQADVLFATYDPKIPNNRYASPNKLFEAMCLGKPIVVAKDTNMDRIVQETGSGLVVTYGSTAELEKALLSLEDQPELRLQLGRQARRAFESKYNWRSMQQRLLDLYSEVSAQ
jgi:glycosyltransferase involved in cell wall biosynthesis